MQKQYRFALNLQLFADGEDFDGGDDTPSFDDSDEIEMDPADFESSDESEDTEQSEDENTTQTDDETEQPATDEWGLPIKYNGEDRVLTKEEAQALAQKGMNYEKAIERAASEAAAQAAQTARDSYIAEQGYEWNGRTITTEADYKSALMEQELMRKYENLPPEVAAELMASRRDREERAQERKAAEEKAAYDRQLSDFLEAFQELHERPYDPKVDKVPPEVWAASQNGTQLVHAYMKHHNKELRNQLKISKQNESNGKKAPIGSVTANGSNKKEAADPFLEGFNSI